MQQPADIFEENERLRVRLQQSEDVVRAFRGGDVGASVDQPADFEAYRLCNEMLAQFADAVISVDESDRITYLNAAAERLYGISASDALGRPQADVFSTPWVKSDDEAAAATALREHGEWCSENVHLGHDGRELSVECRITPLKDNNRLPNGRMAVIRDVSKRKQHDKRVLVSEIRYRRLFEAAHDGVLIVDPETRKIVDANPFMIQLLGYPLAELVDMEIFELGFLGDARAAKEMFQTLKATGQVRYENLPLQTEDGAPRSVEVVANLYDEDGHNVIKFNVRDITERKQAETELRERQNFLNRILEVLPGVLYIFDLDENRVVFVNNTPALTFGTEEIVGMGADLMPNLMHPGDQKGFGEHTSRIRSLSPGATATFEYRMRDKANDWRWYVSTDTVMLRDESGGARQFIGIALEITDRKRVDFALQESEAKYRTLFEKMQEGFSVLERVDGDPVDYRFLAANPAYERHTGLSNPVGKTIREIVPSVEESALESYRNVEETGLSQIVVTHVPEIDLWFEVEASSAGRPGQVAVLFRDISERKRAELVLRENEERQAFLLQLSDALRLLADPDEIQFTATRLLGELLRVTRVFYFIVEPDGESFEVRRDYVNGVPSVAGRFSISQFDSHLAENWRSGRTVHSQDVHAQDLPLDRRYSPEQVAAFDATQARAWLGVPLVKADRLIAVMGISHAEPRAWTKSEIRLAEDVAERTWAAVVRAQAEAALRESEQRLRTLFDNMAEGFALFDIVRGPAGQITDLLYREANKALEHQTGFDRATTIGRTLKEILTPSDAARFIPLLARAVDPGEPGTIEEYAEIADRWFEVSAYRHGPEKVAAFYRDISERKRAEIALRESEARQAFLLRFSDALRAEPSAEALTDRALQMLFDEMRLDRCYVGIYRLAEDFAEFPHQVQDDRLPPLPARVRLSDFPKALQVASDRTLVIDNVGKMEGLSDSEQASFAGLGIGALITATLRKGENNPLWAIVSVSASPRIWTLGEVSLVEEVAERTWAAVKRARAKDRLQIAHDTFRNLINRSPFGTYIVDADFHLIQISDGGKKAFANVRPLIGRDFAEVVRAVWPDPFSSEVIARFRHTLATGESYKGETNERRADTEVTEAYDWKIERIILLDGRPGVVCHFYDYSEKQQQQDRIKLLMGEVNHRSKNCSVSSKRLQSRQ
ncbi:PAS domain S-box protein [Cypionkella sp. TWP1-2-1b2]|uniref:PAS domain S-box protein n=1 Tax=Cypionkella sp. TWP1-2-1b2 TaxID=2804675 RepID=UPI003CE9D176